MLLIFGVLAGIAGGSIKESATIDMVNDGVEDLRLKFGRMVFFEFVRMKKRNKNSNSN